MPLSDKDEQERILTAYREKTFERLRESEHRRRHTEDHILAI